MDYVRREVEERMPLEEAIDANGIECFVYVEENCAGETLFAEILGYSFNEAGQLQGRDMSWSKPKLLVSNQSAFVYYI